MLRFFMKLFFIIKLKPVGTKTRFTSHPLEPIYDNNQYLAEFRKMKRDNSQRKPTIVLSQKNRKAIA